jgi:succinate dehydrogenase / fumarate reductase cytochrome b subunit
MPGRETRRPDAPWTHTEGIGAGFVDSHRPALTSGPTSGQETSGAKPMTDAPRTPREPPVSPHLMTGGFGSPLLWRWHITMWTSILHRVSGVALYVGVLIAAGWAVALAEGPDAYAFYKGLLGGPVGLVVMAGLALSFFYHLANGVRHLVWDTGHGLDVKSANASAVLVLAFAVAATVSVFGIAAMTGAI